MAAESWREDLSKAFARFDADGSGRIDKAEFNQLLDGLGSDMSVKDREIGFTLIDSDDDGSISCEELAAWWEIVREEGQS